MIVGWLYPHREHCGIAIYSRNYIANLKHLVSIKEFNLDNWYTDSKSISEQLNSCDIIHIQYETSFFFSGHKDFYKLLLSSIRKPVIISLHEIYSSFPGVYPRDLISGGLIISNLKRMKYDLKHPQQTSFRKHCSFNFYAKHIFVHHHYQKKILLDLQCISKTMYIAPHPILISVNDFQWKHSNIIPVIFGSTGFINPDFDYTLLFSFLENLDYNWKFIWIGGIRLKEHEPVLARIVQEISNRNWGDRFTITGWVPEDIQTNILSTIDIYFAFFINRSSSGSIARALGAKRLIVATHGECTAEINKHLDFGPLVLTTPTVEDISKKVSILITDKHTRSLYIKAVDTFTLKYNFESMSKSMVKFYEIITKPSFDINELPEEILE